MDATIEAELKELIRIKVYDALKIVTPVKSIEHIADAVNTGLQRAMPCYDAVTCENKRCGECGK